ncbi:MAG: LCP family protein, partial [Pseudonocardiaceae bacterium]
RQQRFLSALLSTAASNQMALNPTAARNFVAAFTAHSITDNAGLDELATLAQSMQELDPATVSFMTAPTTGQPNERGNEVLRDADAKALFTALREDTTLGETEVAALAPPAGGAPAAAPKPGEVTVAVLNASERAGLASQVGAELRKLEFTVASVGNSDAPAERTLIRYSADQEQQATVLSAAVPDATLQLDESGPGVLQLALGTSFDGIVSPLANTPGAASPPPAPSPAAQPAATCR